MAAGGSKAAPTSKNSLLFAKNIFIEELIANEINRAKVNLANKNTSIFLAHGTEDHIIPFPWAKATRQTLLDLSLNISWHEYIMGHMVGEEEIVDIGNWFKKILI